ncbi:DMT family transporter [Candidatus Halobonum tyrrellensis]|uniref:DMT (Drug/metabolite family transporter) superfamily permease n=1 Tax=Candidatus Halobonum tyrrellensis G22 TaxID=1324957 RepID=V4HIS1_9EURY|nr:DMT family transporter [Candidatus Halobonum tyrrellensis]ESP87794.1 DMT (drug/metabolite family transporter) superfamily permease [Candidatus Halobonum tyrrellensis G22]
MSPYRNAALFLLLAAVWGSAFAAIKAGLAFFPPVLFAAVRYDVAGVVMLAYAWYAVDDPVPRGRAEWTEVAVGATLLIAAYHAFLFVGQTDPAVSSAAAAVIVGLNPVLTTGFSRALLPSERLSPLGLVGLVVGFAGAVVLAEPDAAALAGTGAGSDPLSFARLFEGGVAAGVGRLADAAVALLGTGGVAKGLVFLAVVSFALGGVLTRRVDSGLEIEPMEAWSMLLGALLMHAVSVAMGERVADVTWTVEAAAALAYLSLAASALGFLVYFDLLDRLGPVEINLVSYVSPVFAALAGWVLLAETPTRATAVGFCLIFAAFLLLKRAAVRAELRRLVSSA